MKPPRPVLAAALGLSAPLVLLTVALPVGFVMEVGKQATLVVENATGRPLRVTPIATSRRDSALRVAPRTWHPLLPLPAFRAAELDVAPGAELRVVYSARQALPVGLAVREADGSLGFLACAPEVRPRLRVAGPLPPAHPPVVRAVEEDSPLFRWLVLLAGPFGTLVFVAAWRARRRAVAPA